jgi:uncharacterized cupin superfamily protein
MAEIFVKHDPSDLELDQAGVGDWPIWEKEVSTFPWTYDATEVCYVLEGEVIVTPEAEEAVNIRAGDYVEFPAGMSCNWQVLSPIRKHYMFK